MIPALSECLGLLRAGYGGSGRIPLGLDAMGRSEYTTLYYFVLIETLISFLSPVQPLTIECKSHWRNSIKLRLVAEKY